MTKRHFIALADYIKTAHEPYSMQHLETLAAFCRAQNPRFNRERWIGYIRGANGPSGGTRQHKRRGTT